jgi:hypothetical protein
LDPKPKEKFNLDNVPLVGKWFCGFGASEEDGVLAQIWHGVLPVGIWGMRSTVVLEFLYVKGVQSELLNITEWEAAPAPNLNPNSAKSFSHYYLCITPAKLRSAAKALQDDWKAHRAYRLVFRIKSCGVESPKSLLERLPGKRITPLSLQANTDPVSHSTRPLRDSPQRPPLLPSA